MPSPSKTRAFIASATIVAFGINVSWFGTYTFVNAYVVNGLGCSNAEWTRSTLWFIAGLLAGQLVCTGIAARIGRLYTVAAAVALAGVGYTVIAFTQDLRVINPALAAMGLVPAVVTVVWMSMVAEFGAERPGKAMATFMCLSALVGAIAIALAGSLLERAAYRETFLGIGALCIVGAALFTVVGGRMVDDASAPLRSVLGLSIADVRAILTPAALLVLVAGFCMEPFLYLTVNQLFPNLGRDLHGMGEDTIGLIVGGGRLPALASLLVIRHYVDRVSPVRLYGLGVALAGGCVVLMGLGGGATALVLAYLLYYLMYGVVWSANMAALNACVRKEFRDVAFAIGAAANTICNLLAGAFQNQLLERGISLPTVFIVCGGIGAAGGIALIGMRRSGAAKLM